MILYVKTEQKIDNKNKPNQKVKNDIKLKKIISVNNFENIKSLNEKKCNKIIKLQKPFFVSNLSSFLNILQRKKTPYLFQNTISEYNEIFYLVNNKLFILDIENKNIEYISLKEIQDNIKVLYSSIFVNNKYCIITINNKIIIISRDKNNLLDFNNLIVYNNYIPIISKVNLVFKNFIIYYDLEGIKKLNLLSLTKENKIVKTLQYNFKITGLFKYKNLSPFIINNQIGVLLPNNIKFLDEDMQDFNDEIFNLKSYNSEINNENPIIENNIIYISTNNFVNCLDVKLKNILWNTKLINIKKLYNTDKMIVVNCLDKLFFLDKENGNILYKQNINYKSFISQFENMIVLVNKNNIEIFEVNELKISTYKKYILPFPINSKINPLLYIKDNVLRIYLFSNEIYGFNINFINKQVKL